MSDFSKTLLSASITAAVTDVVSEVHEFNPLTVKSITMQSDFDYGSGGTTAKVWLQTSLDGGTTWIDLINHAFTTSDARKVSSVSRYAAGAEALATDATLADDSELDGRIGDRIRLKYTTTGTYADTTLDVSVILG